MTFAFHRQPDRPIPVVAWAYASRLDAIDDASDAARRKLVLATGARRFTVPQRRIFTADVGYRLLTEVIRPHGEVDTPDPELLNRLADNPDGFLIMVYAHLRP